MAINQITISIFAVKEFNPKATNARTTFPVDPVCEYISSTDGFCILLPVPGSIMQVLIIIQAPQLHTTEYQSLWPVLYDMAVLPANLIRKTVRVNQEAAILLGSTTEELDAEIGDLISHIIRERVAGLSVEELKTSVKGSALATQGKLSIRLMQLP